MDDHLDGMDDQRRHFWQTGEWVRSRRTGAVGQVTAVCIVDDERGLTADDPPILTILLDDGTEAESPADGVELIGGGWRIGFGRPTTDDWRSIKRGRERTRRDNAEEPR